MHSTLYKLICPVVTLQHQRSASTGHLKMVLSWIFGSNSSGTDPTAETERGGYECAPYTILETYPEYQVRNYPARKWATVTYEKEAEDTNNDSPMFRTLFGYITGANKTGDKIAMTVPVSTKVTTQNTEGNVVTKEEMGFYVPSELQDSAPTPKEEHNVKIVTRPEMIAFVRQFGGFAKDKDWKEQRDKLKEDLELRKDVNEINFKMYYRQGFDAPFKFWGRKNEVFYVKKTEQN